jgi:D-alanyl-D-alanine carboxypeptidase (penicillin-binding protein 5/6)
MIKIFSPLFIWFAATLLAHAQTAYPAPLPPEIEARAYLLIDLSANQVLASQRADQPIEPASLTKLMTAYLVFDALKAQKLTLDQRLPVSVRAWKMPGSRMFIDPKMAVRVEDLIKGMIVQSGNDATVALAEGVAGSVEGFVQMMNAQAAKLGMKNTAYKNPEGLTEDGHTTTALDLAVLSARLIQDFPQFVPFYALQKFRLEGSPKSNDTNRNKLLFRDSAKLGFVVDGLKTGHTDAAGYCLIASSKKVGGPTGERRLLSIVLGAANENARAIESEKLLVWGYSAFELVKLFDANAAILTPQVWKGERSSVKLGAVSGAAVNVAIPAGSAAQLTSVITRQEPIMAPIVRGQELATLKVSIANQTWRAIPLTAMNDVPKAGWLGRSLDTVRLWWH